MTGTPDPRPSTGVRRRLAGAFTERLGLKATALLLAVVLWVVVNAKEPQEEDVPVRFQPVLDSSLVLRDQPPTVHALVAGAPTELIKLASTPPVVRRQITSDSPDTVVVDLGPDDVILPEGVNAVVRDVVPRSITLRFESTWTRKVPVQSMVTVLPIGLPGAIGAHLDPDSVSISGPRHVVLRIAAVRTARTFMSFPDSLPHLVDIDTVGLPAGVRVRPAQIKVQLVPTASP